MDLRFNFAATNRRLAVVGLTSNIFVNKHSDFLALGFLTGFDAILTLGLSTPEGFTDNIPNVNMTSKTV